MQGEHRKVLLLFDFLVSSPEGFSDWYVPLLCADLSDWWLLLDCFVFIFWCCNLPSVWKIYSDFSSLSQNSTISVHDWVAESNPFIINPFYHSLGSKNYTSFRILSAGKPWTTPKEGNFYRYSTIKSIRKMNSDFFPAGLLHLPSEVYLLALERLWQELASDISLINNS